MSRHGEVLEIAILPAGGRAKQVVQRALGKRRAHIRVHSLCDIADASVPMLALIASGWRVGSRGGDYTTSTERVARRAHRDS